MNKFYKSLLLLFMVSTADQACAFESSRYTASAEATGLFVGVACGLGVAGYLRYRVSQVNALEAVEINEATRIIRSWLKDNNNFEKLRVLALKETLSEADKDEMENLCGEFDKGKHGVVGIAEYQFCRIRDAEVKIANAKKPFSRTWPIAIPLGAAAGIVAAKLWTNAQKTPLYAS